MAKKSDIIGTIDRIKWRAPDSNYVIAGLEDGTTIVGNAAEGDLFPGITYQFFGDWDENAKFGRQFKFVQLVKQEPHSRHGVVCYLARYAPGVGNGIAAQLFDAFGSTAVQVLRTDPEQAARRCPRLTIEKAKLASQALKQLLRLEDTKIDLTNLFAGRGFNTTLVDAVVAKWGILAPERVRRDPFSLLVHGFASCGFARCDRLYADLGLPQEKIKRQVICLWHVLREESNGSTWHDSRAVVRKMAEAVGGVTTRPGRAIKVGVRAGWIAVKVDAEGRRWLAEGQKAKNEKFLAERISELITNAGGENAGPIAQRGREDHRGERREHGQNYGDADQRESSQNRRRGPARNPD